jgi:hypothetical protein
MGSWSFRERYEKLKSNLGLGDEEEELENQSLLQQFNEATTLDRTQRALGFAVCFALGMLMSSLSTLVILRPVKFATIMTMGNILSMGR